MDASIVAAPATLMSRFSGFTPGETPGTGYLCSVCTHGNTVCASSRVNSCNANRPAPHCKIVQWQTWCARLYRHLADFESIRPAFGGHKGRFATGRRHHPAKDIRENCHTGDRRTWSNGTAGNPYKPPITKPASEGKDAVASEGGSAPQTGLYLAIALTRWTSSGFACLPLPPQSVLQQDKARRFAGHEAPVLPAHDNASIFGA